jgi:hypothetical protein
MGEPVSFPEADFGPTTPSEQQFQLNVRVARYPPTKLKLQHREPSVSLHDAGRP